MAKWWVFFSSQLLKNPDWRKCCHFYFNDLPNHLRCCLHPGKGEQESTKKCEGNLPENGPYCFYMHVPLMRIQPQDHDCERRLNVLIQAGKLLQSSSSIIGKVNLSFWWKPCCLYNLYLCVYNLWLLHSSCCWHILSFVPKAVYLGLVSMFL